MIFDGIIKFFINAITFGIGLFPSMPERPEWFDSISNILGYINAANQVVPVTPVFVVLGFLFLLFTVLHGTNLIRRVISFFAGGGGA